MDRPKRSPRSAIETWRGCAPVESSTASSAHWRRDLVSLVRFSVIAVTVLLLIGAAGVAYVVHWA